jgi:signal transduction histidine kinase/ligand-binding sensor domain-containing protein/DNA-binding response OmpR family regulator
MPVSNEAIPSEIIDMLAFFKNTLRRILVLFLLTTCCMAGVWAQSYPVNFTSLTSKDGLSSNIIHAIVKDRFGWMWFATEDGLNRFDGNRFTVYRHIANDTNSLRSNDITCLHEDKTGNLWVGTNGGFLSFYDRKRDAFVNVRSYFGGKPINSAIKAICSDYQGRIWVSIFGGGLYVVEPAAKKMFKWPMVIANGHRASADTLVTRIFEDSKRRLWIGANDGLFLFDRNKGVFYAYRHSNEDAGSLVNNAVKTIAEDKKGNIWIGTAGGLSMLPPGGSRFRNFTHSVTNDKSLSNNFIYTVAANDDNTLWVGTEEGISIMDVETGACTIIKPDARSAYSLNRKSVRVIYIDEQGIYWLSTYQGGINKYNKNLNLFQGKQSNPFDPKGLSAPLVTSFAAGSNGNIFVGTDGGGLHSFDTKSGLFTRIKLPQETTASSGLAILALEKGSDGGLWIGTFANGLFHLNPATGKCRQFKQGTGSDSLNNNDIFCIKEDNTGKIWIGTNGGGVNVFDPASHTFRRYIPKPQNTTDVPLPLNSYIRCLEEDKQGHFWIGSHGTGVAMLDPVTNKCRVYNRTNSQLASDVVMSILEDHNGNIWVGTIGGGLNMLNKQRNQFVSYSEKEGLANGIVYKIIEDEQGLLWVSTNAGISSFDVNTKRFTNYTHYNGIQNNNFVMGSGIRLPDGELFFGGLDGFNFFYPRNLKQNKNVPPVLLTDLKVANQSVLPSAKGPIKEHISIVKEISLDYQQSFSLSYAALDYTSPEQNRYAYKLEGFDKTWIEAGHSKTAYFTNIDPGDYVFRVKASNNNGVWNAKEASVIIHIKPPLWRTWYAYLFYFLLIIGLLLFSRYRTLNRLRTTFAAEQEKLLARQVLEQERKEAEVARELDQLKIKFLTNLSHEFRTPISLIMAPVDTLLSKPTDEKTGGHLYMIKRNARRLLNLVNQLLDFRKMEEHELVLHTSQGEVIAFIKEVFDSFKDLSERKNIHYVFDSQVTGLFALFDHDKLERILFNLLSNAFKFTPSGGTIQLRLEKTDEHSDEKTTWLTIRVADTGIGIPEDKQAKIFERFFQNPTSAAILNQGSGIGLSITKEFVTMHGGTISVRSRAEEGTEFVVQLPFASIDHRDKALTEQAQRIAALQEAKEPALEDNTEKPTLLLVEDNDDFRFYLKDNLKAFYKVLEAADGRDGWQKALAHHPQLIVSDINMPLMDGIQLSQKIRADKRTSHIPIILLTALTGEDAQLKGLSTGANDYLTKPFNFEILHMRIKNLLQQNRTLQDTFTKQIKVLGADVEIESESARLMQKVLLYIEENLTDINLSVEGLSKHVGMSRSTLYNKMLELTGQTPVDYIRTLKLNKAAALLEKSDMNVAQIAYSTGFATPNYFAKAFKAKFNLSPSEYASLKRKH